MKIVGALDVLKARVTGLFKTGKKGLAVFPEGGLVGALFVDDEDFIKNFLARFEKRFAGAAGVCGDPCLKNLRFRSSF